MPAIEPLIPVLVELVKYAPGLGVQSIGLFHSTGGNPTADDWAKLAASVKPFDAPAS